MSNLKQMPHILLSSVGISGPKQTEYAGLNSALVEARFSAFGLWQLLAGAARPDEVWFLLTPKAKQNCWEAIQDDARQLGVRVRPVDLSGDMDDSHDFLQQTAQAIPRGCRLTLNLTEGLRHHAFLFYALALYLTAFREVELIGAWYCRLETENREDPKPLIDLKPTLDLAHWFHGLAVFRETGSTRPIANLIKREEERLRREAVSAGNDVQLHRRATTLEQYVDRFGQYAFASASGLPLELGKVARWLSDHFAKFAETETGRRLPLADELALQFFTEAERVALRDRPSRRGNWKNSIALDWDELQRQATLIDEYFEKEQYALGVGLLREWVISWLMWRSGARTASVAGDAVGSDDGKPSECPRRQATVSRSRWLDYGERKPFERWLGSMQSLVQDEAARAWIDLTEEELKFLRFWSQLSDSLRNTFHHHGMREESLEDPPPTLDDVRRYWQRLKRDEIDPPKIARGQYRLLVCHIGLTPGVFYWAVRHAEPDRILAICSERSSPTIDEVLERTGSQPEVMRLEMQDVFGGVDEFEPLMQRAARWLFEASEIVVCRTGGTSVMGALSSALSRRARESFGRPTYEFLLIDRDRTDRQREAAWQSAAIYWLGSPPQQKPIKGAAVDKEEIR